MPPTGYNKYRHDFAKVIWQTASPKWNFNDATFDRSAASFDNLDHVNIVIHNYRWRLGLAEGETKYDDLERRLAEFPVIAVPTITLEGDANGAPHPDPASYADKYTHRLIAGGIGHNLPQEAPRPSPRPSSRSTATDRRAHAPHNRDTGRHHVAPCPVLIPSSGKGAPPLPPPRLRGRKRRASAGIRRPCRMTGPGPGCRRGRPTLTPKNRWPTGPGRPCRGCPPRVAWP